MYCCCILGLSGTAASLADRAFPRAKNDFRPTTQKNYSAMFKLFLGFCVPRNLNVGAQLVFMEFLAINDSSYSSIVNHVSAKGLIRHSQLSHFHV